jgi:hypothetical protein
MISLKKTIHDTFGVNDSCVKTSLATQENQKNLNGILDNIQGGSTTIRGQLTNLFVESVAQSATGNITSKQAYEMTAQNQAKAREAVLLVVGSMKELNDIIAKNPLNISSSNNCNAQYSSTERMIFGVAEMVEDLSPLLIQAISKIPGLQDLGPVVVGASMISSAITQYANVAQKRVDINKPENRKAILINTCQLVKTYNKMRLLRGLKTNPAGEKMKITQLMSVQAGIIAQSSLFKLDNGPQSSDANQWIADVDHQNENYQSLLQMRETLEKGDATVMCNKKAEMNRLAEDVVSVHKDIVALSNKEQSLQDEMFVHEIAKYKSITGNSTADCARSSKTLLTYTDSLNRRTFQILMDFKKERMSKDKNFLKASYSLDFLRSFQTVLNQMNTESLFEKLQRSIAKTEALVNQSQVLKAWFGDAKNFYMPGFDQRRNPVYDLMHYHELQALRFREPLLKEANQFDGNLYELYRYYHKQAANQTQLQYQTEFLKVREDLSILTPLYLDMKNVTTPSGRSSAHQKACTSMLAIRDNYQSFVESWSTLRYMCQMLKPLINEPEVSPALREYCEGVNDLVPNSRRIKLSTVDQMMEAIGVNSKRMPTILKKIQELKCEE